MNYTEIVYERRNDAAWIGINRPEVRNAFREQTLDEIAHALNSTREDPTIVAAVIYGIGEEFDGNLTRRHLRTDTPYNTYTRHGLPQWRSVPAEYASLARTITYQQISTTAASAIWGRVCETFEEITPKPTPARQLLTI